MTSDGPPSIMSCGICDNGHRSIDMISREEHRANSNGSECRFGLSFKYRLLSCSRWPEIRTYRAYQWSQIYQFPQGWTTADSLQGADQSSSTNFQLSEANSSTCLIGPIACLNYFWNRGDKIGDNRPKKLTRSQRRWECIPIHSPPDPTLSAFEDFRSEKAACVVGWYSTPRPPDWPTCRCPTEARKAHCLRYSAQ